MASSPPRAGSPVRDTKALTDNAAFMDKYSRQIGAFGMEAMSKLIQLNVCGEREGAKRRVRKSSGMQACRLACEE